MSPSEAGGLNDVRHALDAAAERVRALLAAASDLSRPVPRSEWTAAQTAAHLVGVCRLYAEALTGDAEDWATRYRSALEATPARVAAGNARTIEQVLQHDAAPLTDQFEEASAVLRQALSAPSAHAKVATPWYGEGQSRHPATLASIALGELLVHGYDIAAAVGQRWRIDRDHARLVLPGAMSMIPHYVDPTTASHVDATYMIHVRGGDSYFIRFRYGTATVGGSSDRIDCHLSADPVAFLLVGYGRIGQWGPIAKGKLVAWGRKPWLGVRFRNLLLNP